MSEQQSWALETMLVINNLTSEIRGKAFEFESRLTQEESAVHHLAQSCSSLLKRAEAAEQQVARVKVEIEKMGHGSYTSIFLGEVHSGDCLRCKLNAVLRGPE